MADITSVDVFVPIHDRSAPSLSVHTIDISTLLDARSMLIQTNRLRRALSFDHISHTRLSERMVVESPAFSVAEAGHPAVAVAKAGAGSPPRGSGSGFTTVAAPCDNSELASRRRDVL